MSGDIDDKDHDDRRVHWSALVLIMSAPACPARRLPRGEGDYTGPLALPPLDGVVCANTLPVHRHTEPILSLRIPVLAACLIRRADGSARQPHQPHSQHHHDLE